jgi:hypothetical protein
MPSSEPACLPTDFAARCARINHRINDGEAMSARYIADALGLPLNVFAHCVAVYAVAAILVGDSPSQSHH